MDNSPDFLTHYEMKLSVLYSMVLYCNQTELLSWTKVLGHFCISGAFSNSHRPNLSPHPQTMSDTCIQNFFSLNFVWGWGGRGRREMQENFEKEALFDEGTQNDKKICPKDFCLWLYRFDFKITAFSNDFYSVLYQQYCYSLRWVVDSICPAFSLLVCASCICCSTLERRKWMK